MTESSVFPSPPWAQSWAEAALPAGDAGRVVAVVVTHDRLGQLRVTLPRLLEAAMEELSAVVVVDNASSDGTMEWLRQNDDPRLFVVRSDRNLGGAGGFDLGMRQAVLHFAPDWLLLMDDDARPDFGALRRFHDAPRKGAEA